MPAFVVFLVATHGYFYREAAVVVVVVEVEDEVVVVVVVVVVGLTKAHKGFDTGGLVAVLIS